MDWGVALGAWISKMAFNIDAPRAPGMPVTAMWAEPVPDRGAIDSHDVSLFGDCSEEVQPTPEEPRLRSIPEGTVATDPAVVVMRILVGETDIEAGLLSGPRNVAETLATMVSPTASVPSTSNAIVEGVATLDQHRFAWRTPPPASRLLLK